MKCQTDEMKGILREQHKYQIERIEKNHEDECKLFTRCRKKECEEYRKYISILIQILNKKNNEISNLQSRLAEKNHAIESLKQDIIAILKNLGLGLKEKQAKICKSTESINYLYYWKNKVLTSY